MLDEQPDHRIADLVAELATGHRLAALEVEGDQETAVRATFDLSYQAIAKPARHLFRLLGLVPGPDFTPDAAAALANVTPAEARQHLDRLASAHLVSEHTPGRYTFHDLLREYARNHAHEPGRDVNCTTALTRLLDYYLAGANAAAALLYPQALRLPPSVNGPTVTLVDINDRGEALAWLEAEGANLVAAVEYASRHPPHAPAYLLADALRRYFAIRHRTVELLTVANAALAAAERDGNAMAQAAAAFSLAELDLARGRYQEAADRYTAAAAQASQADWVDGYATALGNAGIAYAELGRLEVARTLFQRAIALPGGRLFRERQAIHGGNLGTVEQELGLLRQAAGSHTAALTLHRALGSVAGEATALTNLGYVNQELGRTAEAAGQLTQALTLQQEAGDRSGESSTHERLAAVFGELGQLTDALRHAHAAVAAAVDDDRYQAEALSTLGTTYLLMGQAERALDCQRRALAIARHSGARRVEIVALLGLSTASCHLERHREAADHADLALWHAREVGYRILEGKALNLLADIRLREGLVGEARDYAAQALDNHRRTGYRLGEARTLTILGRLAAATGDYRAARRWWQEARDLFEDLTVPVPAEVIRGLHPNETAAG